MRCIETFRFPTAPENSYKVLFQISNAQSLHIVCLPTLSFSRNVSVRSNGENNIVRGNNYHRNGARCYDIIKIAG